MARETSAGRKMLKLQMLCRIMRVRGYGKNSGWGEGSPGV